MAAHRMRHRMNVEREVADGTDDYGNPTVTIEVVATEAPCYVWVTNERTQVDENRTAVVTDARLATGYSLQEGDRITDLVDRRGNSVLTGAWRVDGLAPRVSHVEAVLTRTGPS